LINLLLDTVDEELLQQTADSGMTPLHFACLHQNDASILAVLTKNEIAAKMLDNQRKLPLHFACGQYSVLKTTILHTLLNNYPESVSKMTENNSLPIHLYIEAKPKGKEELLFLTCLIYQARNCLEFANNKEQYPLHITC